MANGVLQSLSFLFSGGMTSDISDRVLRLPLLERAEGCRYLKTGSFVGAPHFHNLGGTALNGAFRIFSHNNDLFLLGGGSTGLTGFVKYDRCQKKWNGIDGFSGCNVSIFDVAQRESDLTNVGICHFEKSIYVFYCDPNEDKTGGRVLYRVYDFSCGNDPEISVERECLSYTGEVTGLFAYAPDNDYPPNTDHRLVNKIVLVVSTTENCYFNFYDNTDGDFKYTQDTTQGVRFIDGQTQVDVFTSETRTIRNENDIFKNLSFFYLYRNTMFYSPTQMIGGLRKPTKGTVVSFTIDGATKVQNANVPFPLESPFIDSFSEVENFDGLTLFDFREWTKFKFKDRDFKVLWTPQTGYWIINHFSELTANFYSSEVPFSFDESQNMKTQAQPVILDDKVFLPVLKSGQPEQRDSNLKYPLGVSLVRLDFSRQSRNDRFTPIGKQGLLSGSALRYFNGIDNVEYGFAEKAKITKTENEDYDVWPYGDLLEKKLPKLTDLTPDQYTLFDSAISKLNAPYTVQNNVLSATGPTGGSWKDDVAANRALRYSSNLSDGTALKSYPGVLSTVSYEGSGETGAIVATFTSAPTTLDSGFTHPKGILINSNLYEFQESTLSSGTLTCKHFVKTSPFVSGNDYIIKIPSAEELTSPTDFNALVRTSTTSPARKEIRCVNVSFKRFKNHSLQSRQGITALTSTSNIAFGTLRQNTVTRRVQTAPAVPGTPGTPGTPPTTRTIPGTPSRTRTIPGRPAVYGTRKTNFRISLSTDPSTRVDDFSLDSFSIWKGNSNQICYYDSGDSKVYLINPRIRGIRSNTSRIATLNRPPHYSPAAMNDRILFIRNNANGLLAYGASNGGRWRSKDINNVGSGNGFMMGQNHLWIYNNGWKIYNTAPSPPTLLGASTGASIPHSVQDHYVVYGSNVFIMRKSGNDLRWTGFSISGRKATSIGSGTVYEGSDTYYLRSLLFYGASGRFIVLANDYGRNRRIRYARRINSLSLPRDERYQISPAVPSRTETIPGTPSRTETIPGTPGTPGTPGRPAQYRTVTSQVPGPEGWIKSGYKSKLSIPSNFNEAGSGSSTNITDDIELTGIYTDSNNNALGSNLYLYFSSDAAKFANPAALDSALRSEAATQITKITFTSGANTYTFNTSSLGSGDVNQYTSTPTKSVRWNLRSALASSALLRSIIQSALTGSSLSITFQREGGTTYSDVQTNLKPHILSAVFRTDEALDPDTTETDTISNDLVVSDPVNDSVTNSFKLPAQTQRKISGDDGGKHYYYKKTTDNPLSFSPFLFSFDEPLNSLSFRYVLVETAVRSEDLLRARIYKYKCRYKWLDSQGIEHRSRASDIITLFSNSDFGQGSNKPSFEVNKLHLSDKPDGSISIEIYRTEKNTDNFRLVGEIPNQKDIASAFQNFTDEKKDDDLGQAEPPSNTNISGAAHCVAYKGRYVLYGFPEKKNRFVVSSPIREFVNESISFKQDGGPQDFIEILMEEDIQCISPMDQYIIIFTKDRAYSWAVNEVSTSQNYPVEITGFKEITAVNAHSITETQNGLLFLTNKGFWGISRGRAPAFIGKDIQDFIGNVLDTLNLKQSEESYISTDDPNYPLINYNHRFRKYSVFKGDGYSGLISMTNWRDKFIALNSRGQVKETLIPTFILGNKPKRQIIRIKTGWINVSQIQGYQRICDFYLLAKFKNPKYLLLLLRFNFSEIVTEIIPANVNPPEGGELPSQWRFSIRNRQSSAVKAEFLAESESSEFDALRLDYLVSPGVYLQSSQKPAVM